MSYFVFKSLICFGFAGEPLQSFTFKKGVSEDGMTLFKWFGWNDVPMTKKTCGVEAGGKEVLPGKPINRAGTVKGEGGEALHSALNLL